MAVKIATMVRATVEIATCLYSFLSARLDVPITCELAPTERPIAISFFIPHIFKIRHPNIAPRIPVKITAHAVSSGMPPIVFEISTAIGVVTDFGSIDKSTENFVWKIFPKNAADKIAIKVAKINPKYIARLF